jgi:UDP-N-acetylmuramate dehydrogenase
MMKKKNFLLNIKKNVLLKNHTTFKIGGPAKYFFISRKKEDLVEAIKWAKVNKVPFFILGSGSNVLVSDKGFDGLIIKMKNSKFIIKNLSLYAESGVLVKTLVQETGKRGLSGLEWAGGLPGTLGGAIFGNAGAFGGEIKDNIVFVEALDKNLNIRKLKKDECRFSYRFSIFKKNNWIVLSTLMKLKNGDKKTIQNIARLHIRQRKERGPLEYPNAGSIFKNYNLKKAPLKIKEIFKDVIKTDPFPVIPAAAIIAKAGLKKFRIGGAQVSEKHPNFIINLGNAKADDVRNLINFVKKRVKNKFGIVLEEEIRYLGF